MEWVLKSPSFGLSVCEFFDKKLLRLEFQFANSKSLYNKDNVGDCDLNEHEE